jgi:phosphatidylglycerol:prolipoprotein diacylglycerol transferase
VFPTVVFLPGSRVEIGAIVALLLVVASSVVLGRVAGARPDPARLFSAYVAGTLGLALVAHAGMGRQALEVGSYALVLVASSTIGCMLLMRRLMALGLPEGPVYALLLGGFVLAVIASRLASALPELPSAPSLADWARRLIDRRTAGLSVFGAIITAVVYVPLVLRRRTEASAALVLDACASTLALVIGMGRVGCLLAGCCYGGVTGAGPLSIPARAFSPSSPAGVIHADDPSVHLWATQPIEAVLLLGIALGCERLYRRRAALRLPDGAVFVAGIGVYGLARALLEILRADSARSIAGVLTVWQVLGLAFAAGAAVWGLRAVRRGAA